ncbi:MAG: hypothetical protein ACYDC3_02770 [Candidatus Binataceae bacterium]
MGTLRSLSAARGSLPAADSSGAESALAVLPLPCPDPSRLSRAPLRPHAHQCAGCGVHYRCVGVGDTGFCAPMCAPCYLVELDAQLAAYRAIVASLERERRRLEKSAEPAACLQALENKRRCAPVSAARLSRKQFGIDSATQE